jgi:ATP synthase protein I
MPDRKNTTASTIRTLGALSAVGFAFVLAVLIGAAIGYWLDRLTGLSPLFFILFFFFGLAAGILNVVRTASASGRTTPPQGGDAKPPASRR